ncbi:Cry1 [Columba livia]|nr:Cry1 [Columba livia]
MGVNAVHWFRKGLRLHDNPALRECIQGADTVRCVYILDPWFAGSSNVGINRWRLSRKSRCASIVTCFFYVMSFPVLLTDQGLRKRGYSVQQKSVFQNPSFATAAVWLVKHNENKCSFIISCRFLLQCLEDLDANLRKLNSRLFVIRGQPADVFPRLFKEWNITKLSIEYDSEPFGKERDAAIKKLASEAGVEVIVRISHTLYDLDKIIELNGGQPPLTYKRYQTLISRMEPLEMPVETITPEVMEKCTTPVSDDHDEKYGVPSLEELGFDTDGLPSAVWPGGETEALTRLERHLERKAWVANFERPRMNANSLLASPTGLSPYLRFGCLSCRLFYFKLTDLYKKVKKNSSPPLSLYGQLLWREFFYTAATNNPRFDKMEGNPICVQIPWDKNPEALAKWAEGRTGFPWIDAIMTQLRQEGWIHHLARHAVACFLTRGDLWISWEEGVKVFEELLLDADWSVNAGSWMWLSCSSFFQQFFHCYCPVGFGRRTDPNGDYIRRYLPVLRGFPAKYIYDPWNAPESIQKAAKCIIGVNYPKPMVNHAEASRLNIERMKQIYQQLSRYRGLGMVIEYSLYLFENLSHLLAIDDFCPVAVVIKCLLATVPSNPNGNGNGGLMGYSPGESISGCGSTGDLLEFNSTELSWELVTVRQLFSRVPWETRIQEQAEYSSKVTVKQVVSYTMLMETISNRTYCKQDEQPLVLALVQGNAQIQKKKLRALDQKSSDRAQINLAEFLTRLTALTLLGHLVLPEKSLFICLQRWIQRGELIIRFLASVNAWNHLLLEENARMTSPKAHREILQRKWETAFPLLKCLCYLAAAPKECAK